MLFQVAYLVSPLLLLILVGPKVSRIWCVHMSLLVQLTTPAAVPHLKQTIEKNVSTCLETGLCQEILISWYTQPEKPHCWQCLCSGEEHWWCQSWVHHKLAHCLQQLFVGLFASFSKHPALAGARVRILDKKEAERWNYIKHGLTMAYSNVLWAQQSAELKILLVKVNNSAYLNW